jgi:hypothetical protein
MKLSKIKSNESDIVTVIILIIKNLKKIIFITGIFLGLIVGFSEFTKSKSTFALLSAEIKPITTLEELEFQIYNYNMENVNLRNHLQRTKITNSLYETVTVINKNFLFNLFFEELDKRIILEEAVKKFNLIGKEDYNSADSYEKQISKIINDNFTIKDDQSKNNTLKIVIETEVPNQWVQILSYVEKLINQNLHSNFISLFDEMIQNEQRRKNLEIKKIDLQIKNMENQKKIKSFLDQKGDYIFENEINKLINKKQNLVSIDSVSEIKGIIDNSPFIKNPEKFRAARINIEKLTYQNNYSNIKLYIFTIFIGFVLSVFYILLVEPLIKQIKLR